MWDLKITSIYEDPSDQQLVELIIEGRAGLWAKGFLNRAGQESKNALFQYGYLAEKILQIDQFHHPFAAKAMIYLTLQTQRQTFLVGTLLERVEGSEVIAEAQVDRKKRQELKQQFDDFLLIALELQWNIKFDDSTYPENIRPDFAQEDSTPTYRDKLPQGYFETWLKAKITISPPYVIQTYVSTDKKINLQQKINKTIPSLTGNSIRQAREAKGWSISQLAQKLGVSKMSVSRWESEKRKLTPENEKALKKILDIP